MFVEATPGDTLLKMLKVTEETFKIAEDKRIKFISKAGTKLIHLFERKNPFEVNCNEEDCPPCETIDDPNKLSKCRMENVSYQAKCLTCELVGKNRIYDGETARNLHIRSKEHLYDLKTKNPNLYANKGLRCE